MCSIHIYTTIILGKGFMPRSWQTIGGTDDIPFLPEASIGLRAIVVACVRPSVRHEVCPRDNASPVQARITKFGP